MASILGVMGLLGILLVGAKVSPRGNWEAECFCLEQAKGIQAVCILGIALHHMAQKTCAPWIEEGNHISGLEGFLNLGYLFVGIFLFSSGYGLYKSSRQKEDYFKGFLGKRMFPVIFTWLVSTIVFYVVGYVGNPYTWYVKAILYLYLMFFLIFRKIKNQKAAFVLMAVSVAVYTFACDWLVLGTWWYNTIWLFVVGMLFAVFEEKILITLKKQYILTVVLHVILLYVGFALAKVLNGNLMKIREEALHEIYRIGVICLQFLSAYAFVMLALLMSMKVKVGNKVLSVVGNITLEIYLIHGFFVQFFGYCFVNENIERGFYIRNIWLYTAVVLTLSLIGAYGIYLLRRGVVILTKKYPIVLKAITFDLKKLGIGIVVVIGAIIVIGLMGDKKGENKRLEALESYEKEYIRYVDVKGKKMAAYVVGEGGDTIVLMRGLEDPCPTMTMRLFADTFADEYKVVVLDYLGTGFSDDADTPRTMENIVDEVHTAVKELEIRSPYILMPQTISVAYSKYYVNQYAGEVKAIVALEGDSGEVLDDRLAKEGMNLMDYRRIQRRQAVCYGVAWRMIGSLGFKENFWHVNEKIYAKGLNQKERPAACELFFDRIYNRQSVEEMTMNYKSYADTIDLKYPEDVTVINLYSETMRRMCREQGIDMEKQYAKEVENPENHKVAVIVDPMFCLCNQPESLREFVREAAGRQ